MKEYSKIITVSDYDFKRLEDGKHTCINGVHRLINIKCINEETKEELIAKVSQHGGIFTKSAAIVKL